MDGTHAALVERLATFPERLSAAANVAAAIAEAAVGDWSPSEVVRHLVAVDEDVWQRALISSSPRARRPSGSTPSRFPVSCPIRASRLPSRPSPVVEPRPSPT